MKNLPTFTIMMSLVACLSFFSSVSLVRASSPVIDKPGAVQDKMGNFEIQRKAKPGTGTDKIGNMEIQKNGRPGIVEQKGNMEIQKKMKPRLGTEKKGGIEYQDGEDIR